MSKKKITTLYVRGITEENKKFIMEQAGKKLLKPSEILNKWLDEKRRQHGKRKTGV